MPGVKPEEIESYSLGTSLGPVLREVTRGRLGEIEWFRSSRQRGGAATGYSSFRLPDGNERPVFVKAPVGPNEQSWTLRLGAVEIEDFDSEDVLGLPTPRVLATGESLGGYDLAWLVIERFPGEPMRLEPSKRDVEDLIDATASFQARALEVGRVGTRPPSPDWATVVGHSREVLPDCGIAEPQRWNEALKHIQRVLGRLERLWATRPVDSWCHGDVHPGNAMRREGVGRGKAGSLALLDLAMVHAGSWIEDALYLERQFWGRSKHLHKVKPVPRLARARKRLGLACVDGYAELADAKRALAAACVPANLRSEGDERYCHGALEVLERLVRVLGK